MGLSFQIALPFACCPSPHPELPIDRWIDRETRGATTDDPIGSSRGAHNYPSPNAALTVTPGVAHTQAAARTCMPKALPPIGPSLPPLSPHLPNLP